MIIKIYNRSRVLLTNLINSSVVSDFNDLKYRSVVSGVGDASFVVRTSNAKVTQANFESYNVIAITEDDGTVRWNGVIIEKSIKLNTITVKCYDLLHILDRRVTTADLAVSGNANTIVSNLLSTTNAVENTGISAGVIDLATYAKATMNREKVLSGIQGIANYVGGQFLLNPDKTLDFQSKVGTDLSANLMFRFEKNVVQLSNILSFSVADIGREIVTKTYGESGAFSSTQTDATLQAKFGTLEAFENFRENQDQTSLDTATANNNTPEQFSPDISLSPEIADDFEAGDTVNVKLDNGFIALDGDYQIMEKSVQLVGIQKNISVKLNSKTADFMTDLKKMAQKIDLLNSNV